MTVAAALLVGAALAGCALEAQPPPVTVVPPPAVSGAPVAVAQPRPSLAPPVAVPEPPVPTARHTPLRPVATPPVPNPPAEPVRSASPAPAPDPTPAASPTPRPTASPTSLVALLQRAAPLPSVERTDAAGTRTTSWAELAPPRGIAPALAVPHAAAARSGSGACATAADAVDGQAVEAASTTLVFDQASDAPIEIDLVLVRYPSAEAAGAAVAALQALGTACEGVVTAEGTLGSGTPSFAATAVLAGDGTALVADAAVEDAIVIAVVHERAPAQVVGALVRAQVAALR